uniref:Uncharacterized protein n=1 Tax=Oryza meridionalis TaxID=40149 RepID=A0A0E0E7I4_9ORYZ
MTMRYLAGKLRAPAPAAAALRRPRSLSANASQGGRSNATTDQVTSSMNVARNKDGELGWVQEEVAKLEELRKALMEHTTGFESVHTAAQATVWPALLLLLLLPQARGVCEN